MYYRIYDLFGRRYATEAKQLLRKSQYWDRGQIEAYQLKKLKKIIGHAKNNIPYYQRTIKSLPGENWNYKDMIKYLQDIPVLNKKNIQQHFEDLIDPGADKKRMIYQITGGTSGNPIRFYHDRKKLDYTRVALQRNFNWAGYYLRKRCLKLASGSLEAASHSNLKGKIKNKLHNRYFYEAAVLDDKRWVNEILQIIHDKKIKVLWGYPSIIYMLARELHGMKNLGIETIATSSETLQDSQRKLIEEVFECPVFDEYSSREFMIAGECEHHKGLHINEELLLPEILDEHDRPCGYGENGKIIITDLLNYGFPFIRYEIGDNGSLLTNEKCSCGRTLKRLKNVSGRSSDNILINGKAITTVFFPGFFKTIYDVEAFQVLVYPDAMTIYVILRKDADNNIIKDLDRRLNAIFDNKIPLTIKRTGKLIREANGKVKSIKRMD